MCRHIFEQNQDFLSEYPFIPYKRPFVETPQMEKDITSFYEFMNRRRSVREFSSKAVPRSVIENIIMTASTAPSGAHKQPWKFCAVSNAELKSKIREAAEEEEKVNYSGRMSDEWLRDLAPLGTDEHKPFLEVAPWLIIMFKKAYEIEEGEKRKNYYVNESVGLAAGFLLAAIHHAGLVALTHTPSPMDFLGKLLNRPSNERAFLLIPVGYPAHDAMVPDIERRSLNQISEWYE